MYKAPWTRILATAVVLAGMTAGCGQAGNKTAQMNNNAGRTANATTGNQGGTNVGTTGTARTAGASGFKVGLVTDTGGLNDHGFNHLAYMGLTQAEQQLHISGDVVQSNSPSDYVPNLSGFARRGYKLVIAVGFLMDGAVKQVAKSYPGTRFLIIDDAIPNVSNVACELFRTEQCGYLVGAMAGWMERAKGVARLNPQNVVGVVGGQSIPPVTSYIAGFIQGMRRTDPSGKVEVKYVNSFSDAALASQIAQSEISDGADILFQVAGGAGLGVIQAAKNAGIYAIGVDADQSYLGKDTIITSALKRVDTATFDVIRQTLKNQFKSGLDYFDLANNGVGIAPASSAVPKSIVAEVNQLAKQIRNGTLTVSPNMPK